MIFNSLEFGLFFGLVFGTYWCLGRRAQNYCLLVASYVFYGAWDWRFLGLIALSTAVDYWVGRLLGATETPARRKLLLSLSLLTNLGILGVFKYLDWLTTSFAELAASVGWTVDPLTLEVVLPVGISFYTFQTLSYTIDVYRRELAPTRNVVDFALFVAFFPQLVAGPIERASRLLPQIASRRHADLEGFQTAGWLILWGLIQKVVIADNLAAVVDAVYAPAARPTAAQVALGTFAFAIQIYCDFSGYSKIARGVARLLGFRLMVNFDLPYFSRDPAEIWRRWHISLSTWLRDYVYRSLRDRDRARHGRRGAAARSGRNLVLTMLLCGVWHGAGWHFVVWGLLQGLWLAGHRAWRARRPLWRPAAVWARQLQDLGRGLLTFTIICLTFIFFRAPTLGQALDLLVRLTGPWELHSIALWWRPLAFLVLPLALLETLQRITRDEWIVLRLPLVARAVLYACLVMVLVLFGEDFGQPFIYFQF
ncbi:MAG: MBOAT family O-acyltransferase [Acidobacteriota bacterium]